MTENTAYIRERRRKEFVIEMQKKGKLPATVTEASERKVSGPQRVCHCALKGHSAVELFICHI